jgi:colicin import membrane protein
MKTLLQFCLLFVLSNSILAQETLTKEKKLKAKTEKLVANKKGSIEKKVKSSVSDSKAKEELVAIEKSTKATKAKESKAKADATTKELKEKSTEVKAKKLTEAKGNSAKKVKAEAVSVESKASAVRQKVIKTKAKKEKESEEKAPRVPDKVTGEYNGKKVYTGPRGGQYYINSNGNKTYIQD